TAFGESVGFTHTGAPWCGRSVRVGATKVCLESGVCATVRTGTNSLFYRVITGFTCSSPAISGSSGQNGHCRFFVDTPAHVRSGSAVGAVVGWTLYPYEHL